MDKIAHVIGVLHYNDATREEMLKRIYWKDKQYTDFGGNFVRYADIKDRAAEPPTGGKGLLNYTHDGNSDYSMKLRRAYLNHGVDTKIFNVEDVPAGEMWKWVGDYLENFKHDTPLERIATERAMVLDSINIYANNDRNLVSKYITPELSKFYGSSPGMNTKIFGYTFGMNYTGRMSDIDEANVKFEEDYIDYVLGDGSKDVTAILDSEVAAPKKHLLGMLVNAGRMKKDGGLDYYLDKKNRYAKYNRGTENTLRGVIENTYEFNDDNFSSHRVTTNEYNNASLTETQFDEKDGINTRPSYGGIFDTPETTDVFKTPSRKRKSLLSKTNDLFNEHKIETLAARFHTSATLEKNGKPEFTDTAKSKFGNSHGRNLLNKAESGQTNGYSDPYCRVWTYHHQYDRYTKAIRPFKDIEEVYAQDPYLAEYQGKTSNGRKYLMEHTVLDDNGMLKIAPKGSCGNLQTEIKNCMFSIENLAWQDVPRNQEYLSKEQQGPNGGRIMWFPPYDLDFNENVNVNWNQSNFIGRGEPVFTYSNTTRSGTLSFAMLIDHPSIVDNMAYRRHDGLVDSDLLRFFAGCDVPPLRGVDDCPENEPTPKQDSEEPAETTAKKEKAIHIKFYVYFPNNYSGNAAVIERENWAQNGTSDGHGWFDYILLGVYTENSIVGFDPIGYEMLGPLDGLGITFNPNSVPEDIGYGTTYYPCYNWKEEGAGKRVYKGRPGDVKYLYRVDFDLHQYLHNKYKSNDKVNTRGMGPDSNYKDTRSFALNSKHDNLPKDATHTFLEAMQSLILAKFTNLSGTNVERHTAVSGNSETEYSVIFSDLLLFRTFDTDRVYDFRNLIANSKPFDIKLTAGATKQDDPNSKLLAQRRCRALKDLLADYFDIDKDLLNKAETNAELIYQDELNPILDDNTLDAKRQRFAAVDLWYEAPEVKSVTEAVTPSQSNTLIQENLLKASEILNGRRDVENIDVDAEEWDSEYSAAANGGTPMSTEIEASAVVAEKVERHEKQKSAEEASRIRYETEAEYFEKIEKTHPFVYRSIIDKFKYFSPAFHSISPEGFNARLTFLQQCTRQGHTIAATDDGFAKTAGNLSFGRMPVCVLKIGDFINTRIVINSLSINYGASGVPQWDLNPEGIGVQPMYAKVQMSITILGGQSLDGPISRLQNAVSFNYYANTGVYDNRSDRISRDVEKVQGGTVRNVKEANGGAFTVHDNSQYANTRTTYENIWAPYPNTVKK